MYSNIADLSGIINNWFCPGISIVRWFHDASMYVANTKVTRMTSFVLKQEVDCHQGIAIIPPQPHIFEYCWFERNYRQHILSRDFRFSELIQSHSLWTAAFLDTGFCRHWNLLLERYQDWQLLQGCILCLRDFELCGECHLRTPRNRCRALQAVSPSKGLNRQSAALEWFSVLMLSLSDGKGFSHLGGQTTLGWKYQQSMEGHLALLIQC
jgi:hypothetical protein